MRPHRSDVFLAIAAEFARRSTCPRAAVGAVIVLDGHIVSHGYNGAPPGQPHCYDVGCVDESSPLMGGCERSIHAEANAIAYAARKGVICEGASLFCTHEPCRKCAELILAVGITTVLFIEPYRLGAAGWLAETGVQVGQASRTPGESGRRIVRVLVSPPKATL